jgi:hypothetical protein
MIRYINLYWDLDELRSDDKYANPFFTGKFYETEREASDQATTMMTGLEFIKTIEIDIPQHLRGLLNGRKSL